ncbi:MAG: hypothetical protein ACFFDK_08580 [Promethearchaeota archaeon]
MNSVINEKDEKRRYFKRYSKIFRKYKGLTVQAFVKKLRINPNDPSAIKSLSPQEAVDILMMIALSSIPFGLIFKKKIIEKLGENPENITFEKIIVTLKSISLEDIKDEKLQTFLAKRLTSINRENIENPFESKIKLKHYPVTKRFIIIPAHVKIAEIIGIDDKILQILREFINDERMFLSIENEQMHDQFQIELDKIQLIKDATTMAANFGINPELAVILCQNFDIEELASKNLKDIKDAIKSSKINVPERQYTDKILTKLQKTAEEQNPNLVSLNKVISDLKLKSVLEKSGIKIRTIDDFKKTITDEKESKTILDIVSAQIKSKKKIESLKAYVRLEKISKNFELNKALIENNLTSFYDITRIPLFVFQYKFRDKASINELKELYFKAQENLVKNITLGSLSTLNQQQSALDYLILK